MFQAFLIKEKNILTPEIEGFEEDMGPYIFNISIRVELDRVADQENGSIEVKSTEQKREKGEQEESIYFLSLSNGTDEIFKLSEGEDGNFSYSRPVCKNCRRE